MNYQTMKKGIFIARPNRFIAQVELDGKIEICHVKNTGRCKELLRPGVTVWLEKSNNPARKTAYDLISVKKGEEWVNVDSQAPNQVAAEWLPQSGLFPKETVFRREVKKGNSRFDFCAEMGEKRCWIEVKGVTLEQNGIAKFPDAPTERGARHLRELVDAVTEGDEAMALFIIQMKGVSELIPNDETDPTFGRALRTAAEAGVQILAVDCIVAPNRLIADRQIQINLSFFEKTC